jgi:hypothetical protein
MAETWFDLRNGELLIGDPAIGIRLEQSGPGDVVNVRNLLLDKQFTAKKEDFEQVDGATWQRDDLLNLGNFVLQQITEEQTPERPITTNHIRRLYILGLSPAPYYFEREFGTFSGFKQEVGSPIGYDRARYKDWDRTDIVNYVKRVAAALPEGQLRVTKKDLDAYASQGDGPGYALIYQRIGGGVRQLNEHLGYPDFTIWDKEDYIAYGVRVIVANGATIFNARAMDTLAMRKRGPYVQTIISHFGSWNNYKYQVIDSHQQGIEKREEKLGHYRERVAIGELPASFSKFDESKLLRSAARYDVLRACKLRFSEKRLTELSASSANIIREVTTTHPDITAGHIEMIASSYDVYDDIWPIEDYREYLKITPEEVSVWKKNAAAIQTRYRKKTAESRSLNAS